MPVMRKLERRPDKKKKRGVILLIVVTLLTLLVLIGITFVLFANRSLQDSDVHLRSQEYREPPEKMFEQAVGQLLFDTVCRSALRGQSLLEDLYGPDFITGQITSVTPTGVNPYNDNGDQWPNDNNPATLPHGQAFAFQFNVAAPTQANQLMPWIDYYTGRVITFTSGNATGHSTRILQYDPSITPPRIHIATIDTKQFGILVPQVNDTFIINGAPFNGTGAGFDDTNLPLAAPPVSVLNMSAVYEHQSAGNLPAIPSGDLVALLPHYNAYDPQFGLVYLAVGTMGQSAVRIDQGLARGGFDEPWDAPDYQNMFLAMVPPTYAQWKTDGDPNTPDLPLLPSFHRPELVNYWVNYMIQSIFIPAGVSNAADQFEVMAQPYGADHVRDNADDDTPVPRSTLPIEQRDRIQNITRCSIFRPMPWDHPNFTGSNSMLPQGPSTPAATAPRFPGLQAQALFNALRGFDLGGTIANVNLYDVDNDNDGLADSIWVDLGFPVVTRPDGKRYKPLFAILVEDLDGRINMNAHGNLAQVARQEIPAASGQFHLPFRPQYRVPNTGFGLAVGQPPNTNPIYLPRGVGFGPAEVDFLNLFFNPATTAFQVDPALPATVNGPIASYENILRGRYTSRIANDVWPGPLPGALPGVPGAFEPLNEIKHHGVPNDFATWGAWYASPPDVWGRGAVVLDWGGQPLYTPFAGATGEMIDNPYELKLSGELSDTDSPYTLSELEKMLRYHDNDAQRLVSRPLLPEAQGGAGSVLAANPPGIIGFDQTARNRMSGRSSYIPAPAGIPPGTQVVVPSPGPFANGSWRAVEDTLTNKVKHPGSATILDMYALKIITAGGAPNPAAVNTVLNQLVPWELRHGEKFDLNRWLGNGFDAAAPFNDNVADDPVEAVYDPTNPPPFNGPREPGWLQPAQFANATTSPAQHSDGIDVNNDGVVNSMDRMLARQLYARNLYCLALLFIDPTFDPPTPHETGLTEAQRQELFARRIAQWAINVVDYRDSDAIMTPFEYDINPWNGWQVDSNLATDGSQASLELLSPGPGLPAVPYAWPNGPQSNERRLVWGCEEPDLLINETLAFHSRNVKDTDVAGPDANGMADMKRTDPMTRDATLDQFRVPQGSLFVEFYCPRPYRWQQALPVVNQAANQKPRLPLELYDTNGFLQLGRLAPTRPGENGGRPVWRLAMAPMLNEEDGNDPYKAVHPQTLAGARSDRGSARQESSSFDWEDTTLLTYPDGPTPPAPVGNLAQFRYAYFGDASGIAPAELAYSFYNRIPAGNPGNFPLLQPGGYAVLGPRLVTYLGSCNTTGNPLLWDTTLGISGYSNQRLALDDPSTGAYEFGVYDTSNVATTRAPGAGGNIRNVLTIVADYQANPFSGGVNWGNNRLWTSGLNITEPLLNAPGTNYYPEPMDPANLMTPMLPQDAGFYDDPDPTLALNDGTGFRNTPVEGDSGANAGRPIHDNSMQNTGTYEDVSSIYLQRLANPNLPWNPLPSDPVFGVNGQFPSYNGALLINPYVTVDWASLDVTVFAGDEDTNRQGSDMMAIDPDDPDPTNTPPGMAFRSRQRAFLQGYGPYTTGSQSIWSPVTANTAGTGIYAATGPNGGGAPGNPYFNYDLSNDLDNAYTAADRHTFGYLNSALGYPAAPTGPLPPPPNVQPYLGEPVADDGAGNALPAPFPWLTYANRPFANPYELLMVPASSPSRLGMEITPGLLSLDNNAMPATVWGPNPNAYDVTNPQSLRMPFGHLLNFFHTEDTTPKPDVPSVPMPAAGARPSMSPHFNRLLDCVEVPSPYTGAERWFNPATGHFDNAGLYRPPFNKISRFRDAGRININTIFDDQILISAMGHFPGLDTTGPGSFSDKVFRSRQGYGYGTPGSLFTLDPNFPTFFANPFRPLDSADLMPDIPLSVQSMRRNGQGGRSMPIEATFLRSDPDPVVPTVRNRLFDQIADSSLGTAPPGVYQQIYRNTERNPYFRYQVLQKLGNTFSTTSNCFAVWMTMGYFEVEENRFTTGGPIIVDAGHPDGLRLGQEIGADSGEIVRHRAFYIIDRSIPVGHVPGQKLNSENCILLHRMIE